MFWNKPKNHPLGVKREENNSIQDFFNHVNPITPGGGALCARQLFNAIFLQVSFKDHGLKLSDF